MASGCEFVLFSFQLVLSDQMYSGISPEKIILSKISCAAMCADRGSCSSFFYKRDARNCFLLDVNITDHQKMTPTLGMRQYKKISSGLQSPSTAIVRDRTADHDGKHRHVSGNGCPSRLAVPYVYHAKGNFCYQDWTSAKSYWVDAMLTCVRDGGMLMKADTSEKHLLFVSALKNSPNVKTLWVGGSSSDFFKRKWKWVDGTPIVNDYWRKEGIDSWSVNNCLSYAWSRNGYKWDDVACLSSKGFFCEASVEGQD